MAADESPLFTQNAVLRVVAQDDLTDGALRGHIHLRYEVAGVAFGLNYKVGFCAFLDDL